MSFTLPFDPLMLLLDDPALLAALLAPPEPALAPAQPAPTVAPPVASEPAPLPEEDTFPDIATMEAMLAQSLLDEAAAVPDLALRQDLAGWLGLDAALAEDEAAFLALLADLPPPVPEDLPEGPSGEGYAPSWPEPVQEDWALG